MFEIHTSKALYQLVITFTCHSYIYNISVRLEEVIQGLNYYYYQCILNCINIQGMPITIL